MLIKIKVFQISKYIYRLKIIVCVIIKIAVSILYEINRSQIKREYDYEKVYAIYHIIAFYVSINGL